MIAQSNNSNNIKMILLPSSAKAFLGVLLVALSFSATLLGIGAVVHAGSASAGQPPSASFSIAPRSESRPPMPVSQPPGACGSVWLTQSVDPDTIMPDLSASCNFQGITFQNRLARTFSISPGSDYVLRCVGFGVERNTGDDFVVHVNIYDGALPGPIADLTLLASLDVLIPAGATLEQFTADFAGSGIDVTIPAGSSIVVEVLSPSRVPSQGGDGTGGFWIGSNSLGQSAPSFIASAECGAPEFVTTDSIGFGDMHIAMRIEGGYVHAPFQCLGDLNGDEVVDVVDLLILFSAWDNCVDPDDCPADLNGDGTVDVADLLILFSNWGVCPLTPASPWLDSLDPSPVGIFGQVRLKGHNLGTDDDAVVVFAPGVVAIDVEFHGENEVVVRVPADAESGFVYVVTGVDANELHELQTDIQLLSGINHPDVDDLIDEIEDLLAAGTASNALPVGIIYGHLQPVTAPDPFIIGPEDIEYFRTRIIVNLAEWPLPAGLTEIPGIEDGHDVANWLNASVVGHLPSINGFVLELADPPQTYADLVAVRDQAEQHPAVIEAWLDSLGAPGADIANVDTYERYRRNQLPNLHGREDKWAYDRIQAPAAWNLMERFVPSVPGSISVRIGIYDSGFDQANAEFGGDPSKLLQNPAGNHHPPLLMPYTSGDPSARQHGTRVASLMVATNNNVVDATSGDPGMNGLILSDQSVTSFYVFRAMGAGAPYAGAQGLIRAIEVSTWHRIHVLNYSWGSRSVLNSTHHAGAVADRRRELRNVARALQHRSIRRSLLLVAAAANEGVGVVEYDQPVTATHGYSLADSLGNLPNAIVVGGIDRNDQRRASSAFGSPIALYAPSVEVFTQGGPHPTSPSFQIGSTWYTLSTGNSFATPLVTGTAALVRMIDPTLRPEEIKDLLIDTSFPVTTTDAAGNVMQINTLKAGYAVRKALLDRGFIQEDQEWTGISKIVIGPDEPQLDPLYIAEVRRAPDGRAEAFAARPVMPDFGRYAPTLRHDGRKLAYYYDSGQQKLLRQFDFAQDLETTLEGPFGWFELGVGTALSFNPRNELMWYVRQELTPCIHTHYLNVRTFDPPSNHFAGVAVRNWCRFDGPNNPLLWWDYMTMDRVSWRPNSRRFDVNYTFSRGFGENTHEWCRPWWRDRTYEGGPPHILPDHCPPGPGFEAGPDFMTWSSDGRARAGGTYFETDVHTRYYNQAGVQQVARLADSGNDGVVWVEWSPDGSELAIGEWLAGIDPFIRLRSIRRDIRNVADRDPRLMLSGLPDHSVSEPFELTEFTFTWEW